MRVYHDRRGRVRGYSTGPFGGYALGWLEAVVALCVFIAVLPFRLTLLVWRSKLADGTKLALTAAIWVAVIALIFIGSHRNAAVGSTSSAVSPPQSSGEPSDGWPVGTAPALMCQTHAGVIQLLPVGGARRGQLPPGSQVACTDGAIEKIALPMP